MLQQSFKIKNIFLLLILSVAYSNLTMASGFRVPELSTVGVGTSNALVANSTEIGALAYNPAAMSFHEGKALSAGLSIVNYEPDVTTANGKFSSAGEDTFLIPNLFFMARGFDNLSFGLAINVPFGLETSWPDETFPAFVGPADIAEPALSKIKMVNLNPNIAYKIDDASSFSAGINFYNLKQLVFNTHGVNMNGSGTGMGLHLGYLRKMGDWNFGLSYKSAVDIDVKGSLISPAGAIAAFAEVEMPSLLQLGAAYKVNDNLQVEFDIEQIGWSAFDKISIKDSAGTERSSSINNWKDTTAYRLGVIYQLNDKTKLLFGYSDDPTPQELEYFSARVPDSDRVLYSLGFTHDLSKDLIIEASYMMVDVDSRNINTTKAYTGVEANGTLAYNGNYESNVDMMAVGLTMKF